MDLNYSDIVYFIEVSATKNISRAAERLGVTQPSLSAAMKRLENSLNTELLIRSKSGVQLTKAGKDLAFKGRQLLLQWDQLKTEIGKNTNSISGEFHIGCHPSLGLYTLPEFLPKLLEDHEDIRIKLKHGLSREITEAVISFELDFGLVVNPIRHPDLVITPLLTDTVCFWKSRVNSPNQDLKSGNAILICDGNLAQVQKMTQDLKKQNIQFKRIITSTSLENITELAAAGAGIGIIPSRVAKKLEKQNLILASKKLPSFHDNICLIYRPEMQKNLGAKTIIKTIKNCLK